MGEAVLQNFSRGCCEAKHCRHDRARTDEKKRGGPRRTTPVWLAGAASGLSGYYGPSKVLPPKNPTCATLRHGWYRSAASPVLLATLLLVLTASAPGFAESERPRGKVLVVRGFMTVFSLGLDDLAAKLQSEDLEILVVPASMSGLAAHQVARQYARGELRGPLILIGHSLGGDLLPGLARRLGDWGHTVDLMVMIDATQPSDVPCNVRRCVNLYQSNASPTWFRVFRGMPIRATHPATQLVNLDIRQLPQRERTAGLHHFNIDASDWIHDIVIREVEYAVQLRGE
jgi:hypothetical protein